MRLYPYAYRKTLRALFGSLQFVFPMASSSYSSRSRSLFYSVLFVVILALFVIQAYIVAQKFINAPWEEVRAMQFQYNKHRTSS